MSKKTRQFAPKVEPAREIAPVAEVPKVEPAREIAPVAEVPKVEELPVLGEPAATEIVEGAPVERPTFEDFLAGWRRGASFETCAIPPFAGCYLAAGVSTGKEPRTFPIAQLFSLDRSYTDALLADTRISVRIVE